VAETALFAAIQEIRGRYPDPVSAVMPALQLAQSEHGGWLPPEAFREVADALDLTPAYCLSIASFYDMFRLAPVGTTLVEVCTNISCGLAGAQQVLEALESELGVEAGETSADGHFTLRAVECIGGCGWATVVAVDNRHRLRVSAADVPALAAELRGERPAKEDDGGTA
jgi:NADH-quinone oxidoreductase subunit E